LSYKQQIVKASFRLGLLGMLRHAAGKKPKYAIICYHTVGNTGVPFFCPLTAALFEKQIQFLKQNYRVISLSQMLEEMQSGLSTSPAVVLTFDDGYRGVYEVAYPIMKKHGVTATTYLMGKSIDENTVAWYDRIFSSVLNPATLTVRFAGKDRVLPDREAKLTLAAEIVTNLRSMPDQGRIDFCRKFENEYPVVLADLQNRFMTWEQAAAMSRDGFSFGCHTMTHPVLSKVSPEKLVAELSECKSLLEKKLGSACLDFAFPFGRLAECVSQEAISSLGFRSAVTTVYGTNSAATSRFELRRLSCGDAGTIEEFAFELTRAFLGEPAEEPLGLPNLALQTENARA
jgi:peptidoglycan/xylan/chitin deacetylase (PgdA/CDA1 family)